MDYLELYKNYLKTVISKQDKNKIISEQSQINYIRQIKHLDKYFRKLGQISIELYKIDNLEILLQLDRQFKENKELREKNNRGRNQYSVAFHHYVRMIANINEVDTYSEEMYNEIIKKQYNINELNIDNLKLKLKGQMQKDYNHKHVSVIYRSRSEIVSKITKIRAKGVCDLCGERAPFVLKNGMPYLETHHLVWMSKNGPDVIWNTVALCPNCHRKVHNLNLKADLEILKNKIKQYLLVEQESDLIEEFNTYWRREV